MKPLILCLALGLAFSTAARAQEAEPPASLAEPSWPLGFKLPDDLVSSRKAKDPTKADILVWTPPDAKKIRAVMVIPNNTDSKDFSQHEAVRKVAARHELGIVYMRSYDTGIEGEKGPSDPKRMDALMKLVAEKTGIAEYAHAPWVVLGKSSRGRFPYRADWVFPERVIASITYHGETPIWPIADFASEGVKQQSILHVNANGSTEWAGTWYIHVRPSLLNYRAQTNWLPHQIVAQGVGHGDYPDLSAPDQSAAGKVRNTDTWDYLALFLDKALALRLPKDKYPTDAPVTLNQVDPSTGVLIDPFAVEAMFDVPRLPLRKSDAGYTTGDSSEPPVNGFAKIAPRKDITPPEGVPVVEYESGKSPSDWLITDSLKFAMQADPMVELGELQNLMPKPGDTVTIDDKTLSFHPIIPKQVASTGGIALNTGLRPANAKITLLAYTVLKVTEPRFVKVNAVFTAATQIQLVLNGVPVRHKQILELEPGLYPMLLVVRMTTNWDKVVPSLDDSSLEEVALAKAAQEEIEAGAAEYARLRKENALSAEKMIRKFSDVPEDQRKNMFWVADQEQADAWLKYHTIHKQQSAEK